LGRAAASALIGLGFIVSGWSRSPKQLPGVRSYVGDGELASMVGTSDILVSMLPNTPMLNGVIDRKLLSRLPEGAGLVNVGRGEHVVLPDLLRALDDGALCGAVLDVFPTEPLPTNDPIWDHPKVTVTSHLASITSLSGVVRFVKQGLRDGWPAGAIYDARAGY
jgi:glyoxylate/hydroxypyruvate reductase A